MLDGDMLPRRERESTVSSSWHSLFFFCFFSTARAWATSFLGCHRLSPITLSWHRGRYTTTDVFDYRYPSPRATAPFACLRTGSHAPAGVEGGFGASPRLSPPSEVHLEKVGGDGSPTNAQCRRCARNVAIACMRLDGMGAVAQALRPRQSHTHLCRPFLFCIWALSPPAERSRFPCPLFTR